MKESEHVAVCNRTERKDEPVRLKNLKTGETGLSFGCTLEGGTIQVKLENGQLDSWDPADCEEI